MFARNRLLLLLCCIVTGLILSPPAHAQAKKPVQKPTTRNPILGRWTAKDKNHLFVPSDVEFTKTELISPGARERHPARYIVRGNQVIVFPQGVPVRLCVVQKDGSMACALALGLTDKDYNAVLAGTKGKRPKKKVVISPLGVFVRIKTDVRAARTTASHTATVQGTSHKGPKDCSRWVRSLYDSQNIEMPPGPANTWAKWFADHPDDWQPVANDGKDLEPGDVIVITRPKSAHGHVLVVGDDGNIYAASYGTPGHPPQQTTSFGGGGETIHDYKGGRGTVTIWRPK
jgi:hypothetical protein